MHTFETMANNVYLSNFIAVSMLSGFSRRRTVTSAMEEIGRYNCKLEGENLFQAYGKIRVLRNEKFWLVFASLMRQKQNAGSLFQFHGIIKCLTASFS